MALSGITLDRLATYGKKSTLLWLEATIGDTGAVSSVKGPGFSTAVARPHLGTIARTDTGDYTVTLPGDGGAFFHVHLLNAEVVGETLAHTVQAVDLADGTIDLTFHPADDVDAAAPQDPANGSRLQLTILVSDWPHL